MSSTLTTILIVEDDDAIRLSLQEILESEGYTVLTARNGKEGLASIHTKRPDLVLLDLMMPVMSGQQFINEWRKDPSLSDLKVIILSAAANPKEDEFGELKRIRKPLDLNELLTTIADCA